ncbi:hypothetical protein ARMSODRAFT_853751, partial [Armillaria solidipes]
AAAAAYWGPKARNNIFARVDGRQSYIRAHLSAIVLALQKASPGVSLRISMTCKQAIQLVVGSAKRQKACGWRCAEGDLLKQINDLICARTAAVELRLI